MQTDPRVIAGLARDREEENWRFRSFLKTADPESGDLDATVHRITREVSGGARASRRRSSGICFRGRRQGPSRSTRAPALCSRTAAAPSTRPGPTTAARTPICRRRGSPSG